VKTGKKAAIGGVILIDADREDGEVGAIVMKLHQGRCLLDAGWALAPPEIQQDDFAAIIG